MLDLRGQQICVLIVNDRQQRGAGRAERRARNWEERVTDWLATAPHQPINKRVHYKKQEALTRAVLMQSSLF